MANRGHLQIVQASIVVKAAKAQSQDSKPQVLDIAAADHDSAIAEKLETFVKADLSRNVCEGKHECTPYVFILYMKQCCHESNQKNCNETLFTYDAI